MVLANSLQYDSMVPPKPDLYHIGSLISKMVHPFHGQHQRIHKQTEHILYQGQPKMWLTQQFN